MNESDQKRKIRQARLDFEDYVQSILNTVCRAGTHSRRTIEFNIVDGVIVRSNVTHTVSRQHDKK